MKILLKTFSESVRGFLCDRREAVLFHIVL